MDNFSEKIKTLVQQMTLAEKAGFCSGLDMWHTKPVERLEIPSMMMTDGPHGLRKQKAGANPLEVGDSVQAVCFPTASALAASFDRELLFRLGETLGNECQAEDVAILLGPGVNIKRSPLCGRNFEYLSEDPYLAGELAAAYIRGLQSRGVGASLKHFAANNQETRRMTSNSAVDERTLHEIYLAGFEFAIKGGCPKSVMCSYNKINGVYAAENRELLTGILREQWGFEGFVVTDWGAVRDRVKGIQAGLDLEMPGSGGANDQKIIAAVQSGALDEALVDKTVMRILRAFFDYTKKRDTGAVFNRNKDHETAVAIAAECAVLLKNEGDALPLKKDANIAFIGEFAQKPRFQGGGSSFINAAKITGALDTLQGKANVTFCRGYDSRSSDTDASLIDEAVKAAMNADIAVIFAGLPDAYESEGFDRKHIDLPENQNALISAVCAAQRNTVVVLHNGAPVAMPWIHEARAVLEMYLGGEGVGEAAVSLLYGEVNPSGRLAETFPLKLSDNPSYLNFPGYRDETVYRESVYVGYRYYDTKEMPVLFPFGHGLGYTTFKYSAISIDKAKMQDTETCAVTAAIKNTSSRAGKEVVQLYVRSHGKGIGRPARELKGFVKISLEPGEETTVSFTLDKRAFAYYEEAVHGWMVESGEFTVELGASSRDIRLAAAISVESTQEIPVVFTPYSPIGDIMATRKGQAALGPMMAKMSEQMGGTGSVNLGESSPEMLAAIMNEMPLAALAGFGSMSDEQLNGLLAALNG